MNTKVEDTREVTTKEKGRNAVITGVQSYTGIEVWWFKIDSFTAGLIITAGMVGILFAIIIIYRIFSRG